MLFAWLFGLTMAVANACAVAEPAQSQAEAISAAEHGESHAEVDRGKANCLDFCDKSSIGSPKLGLADDSSVGQTFPVLAPGYATAAIAWLPVDDAPQRTAHELRGSPPLRIALRRLTL